MIASGIDVSKSKSTITIVLSNENIVLKPHYFAHTIRDISQLSELIRSYNEETKIALEATGTIITQFSKFFSMNVLTFILSILFLSKIHG